VLFFVPLIEVLLYIQHLTSISGTALSWRLGAYAGGFVFVPTRFTGTLCNGIILEAGALRALIPLPLLEVRLVDSRKDGSQPVLP
jgi:hypothetical protein